MIINNTTLNALRVSFADNFQAGLGMAPSMKDRVCTTVPSTTGQNTYGWLGKIPSMRQWIGPRVIQNISESSYALANLPFELTVGVDRTDIEDDNLGVYAPLMQEMGAAVTGNEELLSFNALKNGFSTVCYDGQNFFDTVHPVLDAAGATVLVSNSGGGAGTPWFLLCTTRPLKPLLFQSRKKPEFVSKDRPSDDNVFTERMFNYGVDARYNVGYGFWQMAYGSKTNLNTANYTTARATIMSMKGDYGRPLGLVPNLLVVPPTLEQLARQIVVNPFLAGGATNEWAGTAEVLVVPWLA